MIIQLYHPDYEKPDAERKGCNDCRHMQAAVSWWCTNEEAVKYRGASFPGVCNCPFWAPIEPATRRDLWLDNGYSGPIIQKTGERQRPTPIYTFWGKIKSFFGICPHD